MARIPRIRGKRGVGLTALAVLVAGAAGFAVLQTFSTGEPADASAEEVVAEAADEEDEKKKKVPQFFELALSRFCALSRPYSLEICRN